MYVHVASSSPLSQESLVIMKHLDPPWYKLNPGNLLPWVQYLRCIVLITAGLCWYLWCCPTPSAVPCQVWPVSGMVLFSILLFLPQNMAQDHPWTSALHVTMDFLLLYMDQCVESETARREATSLYCSWVTWGEKYLNLAVSKCEVSDGYDLYAKQPVNFTGPFIP